VIAERLVEAGLWIPEEGGYRIHDYLVWQNSKDEIEDVRSKRVEAGRKGGKQKASNLLASAKQTPSNQPSKTVPEEEEEEEEETPSIDGVGGAETAPISPTDPPPAELPQDDGEKPAEKPAKRPFRIPADFAVGDKERNWARAELGLTDRQISHETNKFRDHFKATGKPHLDWLAAWRNWMRGAAEGRFAPLKTVQQNGKTAAPLIQHDTAHLSGWAKAEAEQRAAEQRRGG
jgi:hypothetical protein